jgi:integrase
MADEDMKKSRVKFTAGRISAFACESGKTQAFLWDTEAPGLGLRVTRTGAKAFILQAKLNGSTIRITIGDPRTWEIPAAQAEARRLKVQVDSGQDPREVKAQELAAQQAARDAIETASNDEKAEQVRNAVTLGDIWPLYIADRLRTRKVGWSEHHLAAHRKIIQAGGEARKRSPKLTSPGPLASLAPVRLIDLSNARIEAWARIETEARPSSARLAMRLLKACLNWCGEHAEYSVILPRNPAKSSKAREILGRPTEKHDVLEREQLANWFEEVRKIGNPVISAYLQTLLITGARREEIAELRWTDVDFRWKSLKLKDKVKPFRKVPLTPYLASLLTTLPRRNEWVFSSPTAEEGHIAEPRIAHNEAVADAGLPHLTLHGLRRSFATLSEWIEMPSGIAAQIQGHAPQGVREANYIWRPLDLLRLWHNKIEAWILQEAGIEFVPAPGRMKLVTTA